MVTSSATMACPNCGADVLPAMARCRECGQRLQLQTPSGEMPVVSGSLAAAPSGTAPPRAPVQRESKGANGSVASGACGSSTVQNASRVAGSQSSEGSSSGGQSANDSAADSTDGMKAGVDCDCPGCGTALRASKKLAGKRIKCPHCGKSVRLPGHPSMPGGFEIDSGGDRRESPSRESSPQGDLGLLRQMIDVAIRAYHDQPLPAVADRKLGSRQWKALRDQVLNVKRGARSDQLRQAREAVAALGESGDARAAELLRKQYHKVPRELIGPINRALGELKDPQAFELMLGELIAQGPALEPGVLQGLGQLGSHHAVRPLMMFGSLFPVHRVRVIDAVVAIGGPAAPHLISLLEESKDDAIVTAAIEALGRLKEQKGVEGLMRFLNHPHEMFRSLTAEALGQIGDKRSLKILGQLLEDPSENVRLVAATALSKMPDGRVVRPMLSALEDKSPEVRTIAIQTLAACKEPRVLPRLTRFLESPHEEERIAAAEAMGRLGSTEAVPKLLKVLETTDHNDEKAVIRIVDAFRRLEDARAVLPLLNLLDSERKHVRQRAIEALGKIGDPSARESLEESLSSDPADEVRVAAAKALGEIGDAASVYALENALRGPLALRSQAIIALGVLKVPSSIRAVLDVIDDPAESVRYHAANTLGELGGEEAIHALEKLTSDNAEMVNRAAIKALENLGDKRSDKEIQKAMRRRSAAQRTPIAGRLMDFVPSQLVGLTQQRLVVWAAAAGAVLGLVAIAWIASWIWNMKPAEIPLRGDVASISYSPDGKWLAVGRTRGMLEVWNLATQKVEHRLENVPTSQVGFCADSKSIVLASGGKAQLVPLENPDQPTPLEGHKTGIRTMSFTPDRTHMATFDSDGLVVVWDVQAKSGVSSLQLSAQSSGALALSPDAGFVAAATRSGDVEIWSVSAAEQPAHVLRGAGEPLTLVAYSRDGSHIAAATKKGRIIVWQADQPRPLQVMDGSQVLLPTSLDFVDLQNLFVARAAMIEVLNAESNSQRTIDVSTAVESVDAISLDSTAATAAIGCNENSEVCVVDLQSGDVTATLDVP